MSWLLAAPITEDGGKPLLTAGGFPWGFLVIGLLFVATYLLYRSLRRHLGRIPASFEQQAEPSARDQRAVDGPPLPPPAS